MATGMIDSQRLDAATKMTTFMVLLLSPMFRAHSIARNPILVGFKIVDGNWKKYPSVFFTSKDGFRHV